MGMDSITKLLLGSLAGSAIGAIGGNGQNMQSFKGKGAIDPSNMMLENKNLLEQYLGALMGDAANPTSVDTTIKPIPAYVGGSLPMPIGITAMDDNRLNPSLRSKPGLDIGRRSLGTGTMPNDPQARVPPENRLGAVPRPNVGHASAAPGSPDAMAAEAGDDDQSKLLASLQLLGFGNG
jgi:hypothetical protein